MVPQKMVSYYKAAGDRAFRFCAQPVSYELIDDEIFAEVLELSVVYDSLTTILREILCPEAVPTSRPFDEKGRTCREVGGTKRKSGDTLFRDYRREYKKRFGRMKAGKLEPEELCAWGERAREKIDILSRHLMEGMGYKCMSLGRLRLDISSTVKVIYLGYGTE